MALDINPPSPNDLRVLRIPPGREENISLAYVKTIEAEPEPIAHSEEAISAEDRTSHRIANTCGMRYDSSTNRCQPKMPRM